MEEGGIVGIRVEMIEYPTDVVLEESTEYCGKEYRIECSIVHIHVRRFVIIIGLWWFGDDGPAIVMTQIPPIIKTKQTPNRKYHRMYYPHNPRSPFRFHSITQLLVNLFGMEETGLTEYPVDECEEECGYGQGECGGGVLLLEGGGG